MKKRNTLLIFAAIIFFQFTAYNQSSESLISNYLSKTSTVKGWSESDIKNWEISDRYTSNKSGVEHIYIRQTYQGIPIYNAVANFNIKNGEILNSGLRLEKQVDKKINTTVAKISPFDAISAAAKHFKLGETSRLKVIETTDSKHFIIEGNEISLENIPVQLMFFPTKNENQDILLVWDLSIYEKSKKHWWSVRVDAVTGDVLDQLDWVVSCNFEACNPSEISHSSRRPILEKTMAPSPAPPPGTDAYRVFALPAESPNHAPRSLVVGPSNSIASPYGWHDTNGAAGPEFLTTEGNNVRATEDINDNDGTGFFPNGGTTLNFDFPLNFNIAPSSNLNPAITNLFYMNNIMHDIWYQYGFDEISGNFQENAYGNGGLASDNVWAEAQDGGGTNNANFATPADGSNPRMQMYLWSAPSTTYLLTVNSPGAIAGQYIAAASTFGAAVPVTPITQNLVLVSDGATNANEGCNVLTNGTAISGKIAVVMRGTCGFTVKVKNAQNAGALAVIVINNVAGAPFAMGGTDPTITIPSIMVSDVDGAMILAQIGTGVNATIQNQGAPQQLDGDYDNGIIAHEYGHGISNRLTGGPSASNCLGNAEQMGEGWSDWFGLMLTIEPGDIGTDGRGIGTYATGAPINGNGIRPTPYSTNMTINPSTYATTNNTASISQPHGIGYVWCTMLWDLNWALVNQYGYNSNLYTGTGGNNMAMHLVTEGLKLQPCNPGFVDGRNAILAADVALYGGANQCLIWQVFANRGLGFSASQGSSTSRIDQVEAFDLPLSCQTPTLPPIANFNFEINNCNGNVSFTDSSTNIPQSWSWNFGDGGVSSTLKNPYHTYTTNGIYTVTLISSNSIGSDTISIPITINMLIPPVVSNQNTCLNTSIQLTGAASGSIIWYNNTGTIPLDTTNIFTTPILTSTTTYMVENVEFEPIQFVGPLNDAIGTSGYHNQAVDFTLNFNSISPSGFTILSVWVDANTTGTRTINVWDAVNAMGSIVGTTTVNITTVGPQRIPINITVPGPGTYSIGGTAMDMRRNNGGVIYPYSLPGVVDIIGSSANASGYYYYFYDWEVQKPACRSILTPVTVTVNPTNNVSVNNSACGQYMWPATGITYSNSGNYTTTLTNANGCDSIVNLNLTINQVSFSSQNATACNSYTWATNGSTYTASGTYTSILTNSQGCDSTVTLNLTINNSNSSTETIETCSTYTWATNGATYTSSGIYSTILMNGQGCDSTVTLNLTIHSHNTSTETISACGSYSWAAAGVAYYSSGTYTEILTNIHGCDSTVTLNLTIHPIYSISDTINACNSYTWPASGLTYTNTGNYLAPLSSIYGCDSTISLYLIINTVDATVNQMNDITLQANNGTASYQWLNCNGFTPISGATNQIYVATSNGNFAVKVSENGCVDTSICYLISKVGLPENDFGTQFQIYPNPTKGNLTIDLGSEYDKINATLYNANGQLIRNLLFLNSNVIPIEIQGAPGIYFIEINTNDGKFGRFELIKN